MSRIARAALVSGGTREFAEAIETSLRATGWEGMLPSVADDASTPEDLIAAAVDRWGRLDLLAAGHTTLRMGPLDEMSVDDWWAVVDGALSRPFRLARAAAPHLERSGGSIVFLSSEWGTKGLPLGSAFSAGTAGVVGLMRALARELAPAIRVNVVSPGAVDSSELEVHATALGVSLDEVRDRYSQLALLGRLAGPAEVAATVAFLTSDEARFYTGSVLSPTGGRTRA